ncbi:MAG: hypothetical protein NTY63_04500 [Candidatus Bipolaricaulota bacterium]|nr:hypothetical protein [Candidatus Bipolaricaulota bacterium]
MRMLKGFGIAMAVVVSVVGLAVGVSAASDSVSVNASFSILSWISLSVVGNGDVSFGDIAGVGSYAGSNDTEMVVLSTTSWSIASTILWAQSTLPSDASQATLASVLALTFDRTSGTWGVHEVNVSYEMTLDESDLATLPEGNYNLVIQYTATTD